MLLCQYFLGLGNFLLPSHYQILGLWGKCRTGALSSTQPVRPLLFCSASLRPPEAELGPHSLRPLLDMRLHLATRPGIDACARREAIHQAMVPTLPNPYPSISSSQNWMEEPQPRQAPLFLLGISSPSHLGEILVPRVCTNRERFHKPPFLPCSLLIQFLPHVPLTSIHVVVLLPVPCKESWVFLFC